VQDNLDQVLKKDQQVALLVRKSDCLLNQSTVFQKNTKKAKKKMRNKKWQYVEAWRGAKRRVIILRLPLPLLVT